MELVFLGTGAGMPSRNRNVSAIALRLYEERGTFWLFDCGEATQHQILHSPLALARLEFIFITHLHGDHIYGLPGLLGSRSFQAGRTPLTIFGPVGLKPFVETALHLSGTHLTYSLDIHEVEEGRIHVDEQFTVDTARLEHGVTSYGYRVQERDLPGRLDNKRLEALGVCPGPVYGKLKRGERVQLADGRILNGSEFLSPPKPGRTVTILGDTRICHSAASLAEGADVLVHEATFADAESEHAYMFHHSTARQAAETARRAKSRALVLTHISARYQSNATSLLDEAKGDFENTELAEDGAIWRVNRRPAPPLTRIDEP